MTTIQLDKLIFPEIVTVRLIGSSQQPFEKPGVLLGIHIFARQKNDFFLAPFVTNAGGVVTITKKELLAEVSAHYDSGLMDYVEVEEAKTVVEIRLLSVEEIEKAIFSRTHVWKNLLRGERERWTSIDQLIDAYKNSSNAFVTADTTKALWNADCEHYECLLLVSAKASLGH